MVYWSLFCIAPYSALWAVTVSIAAVIVSTAGPVVTSKITLPVAVLDNLSLAISTLPPPIRATLKW